MTHKLADEIWATILECILEVLDDDFIHCETSWGPFSRRDYSNADVLLVCKRWLRIATPLVFHTCIIRSTAQSQALAKALKKNPEFGVLVKRLRLEGCYGASVPNILEKATRLEDLAITLPLSSKDNGKPMFAILGTLRPRRLIVCNSPMSASNTQFTFAFTALQSFIKTCDTLTAVVSQLHLVHRVSRELATSPSSISHISTWNHRPGGLNYELAAGLLATLRSLRRIEFITPTLESYPGPPFSEILTKFGERITLRVRGTQSCVSLQKLVTRRDERQLAVATALMVSSGRPALSHVPQSLRSTIWTHIIHYACDEGYHQPCSIPWVSRMFWDIYTRNRLRVVKLINSNDTAQVTRTLNRAIAMDQTAGAVVDVLHLGDTTLSNDNPCLAGPSLKAIIRYFSQLTVVSCYRMSMDDFLLLVSVSGQSLLKLTILNVCEEAPRPGRAVAYLPSLRHLIVGVPYSGFKESTSDWRSVIIHAPSLLELELNRTSAPGLLQSLINARLPQLCRLTMSWHGASIYLESHRALIIAHGASVTEYTGPMNLVASVAAHCPALERLVVCTITGVNQPTLNHWREAFQAPSAFANLRHLILHAGLLSQDPELQEVPDLFNRDRFPVLDDIRLHSFSWPQNSSQRGPKVSPSADTLAMVWSQRFADTGVRLVDGPGNKWRSRLVTSQSRGSQAMRAR